MSEIENNAEQQPKRNTYSLILAFVLGVALAALVFAALPKTNGAAQPSATPAAGQGDATEHNAPVDIAATFPSWNADSASLAELVAFVQDVTNPASPNYKEPEERIATFDMDGTIISERAPYYLDYMLLIHRVLDDPTYQASDDTIELMEEVRSYALRGEKNSDLSPRRRIAIAHEFAGMTPVEFRAYVRDFLDNEPVVGFDGMTYGGSLYKPMLEVISYLQANDFDVWMVSACEREVVRTAVAPLGIAPDHVIATDVAYATSDQGDEAAYKVTMAEGEKVILSEPLSSDKCEYTGKVLAIAREIGREPILSFGNSTGDYAMLNYAETCGGAGFIVIADDEVREYGNTEKAAKTTQDAADGSWGTFSMRDDWATIYGEGVERTELPAVEEEVELAEAA